MRECYGLMISILLRCRPARSMWVVCHRAPVASCRRGVLQSCMSEKDEDPSSRSGPCSCGAYL